MDILATVLICFGSIATAGFGVWHLFVPQIWSWYSYMNTNAKELILAVRALNVFLSTSLILFGIVNVLLELGKANRYSTMVVLGATCVLWLIRVLFQILYPQGSIAPPLQYGMLAAFIGIFACFLVSFLIVVFKTL
jgi:hypothetical protein